MVISKVKSWAHRSLQPIEMGELYVHNKLKFIVMCTFSTRQQAFKGVVVYSEDKETPLGMHSHLWNANQFKPFVGEINLKVVR